MLQTRLPNKPSEASAKKTAILFCTNPNSYHENVFYLTFLNINLSLKRVRQLF